MSRSESWKTWVAILAILVFTGLLTALWPVLTGSSGEAATTAITSEVPTIEIDLPALAASVIGTESVTLSAFAAVGLLTAVVIGAIVVVGVPLALAYVLLSRQVNGLAESEEFKADQAALEEREKEKIERLREGRTTASESEHQMPRWSMISTSLIVLLFVSFFGMIINGVFVPEGELMLFGALVNSAVVIVGGLVLITLIALIIFWSLRPRSLDKVEATDRGPIPWDFIWVLISGLLVVGLGLGIVIYLNLSA